MDQKVTRAMGELQKLEQRKQQAQSSHSPLRQELKSKMDMLRNKKDNLEAKKRQEANIAANVKALSDQQIAHEAELSTDFKKALTAAEETQLDNLGTTVRDLQRQYSVLSAARSELEGRKSIIEVELAENLQPLLEQLQATGLDMAETGSNDLKTQQRELKRLTKALESLEQQVNDTEESIETALGQVNTLEAENAATDRKSVV